jgi:hypothetical protein
MLPLIPLLASLGCAPAGPTPTIVIDATRQTPISPYIYGANSPDWDHTGLPFTLARLGGNRMTAYNWETNASNAGSDWNNQNDGFMGQTDEPGWTLRTFMAPAQAHGAAVILTIPTAGYVAADKKADGDVAKSPDYIRTRFIKSYPHKPGKFTYPPDTTDRAVFQDECVAWIEKIKSVKTPVWFMLDNEPDIWASTHSRIWTRKPGYADIIDNNIAYATAIKAVAPKALVFGPASYGWMGFRTFQGAADANGRDFLDTYLDAMHSAESTKGHRLLDVLDVHWYPEARGDNVRVTENKDTPGLDEARIQAPRSLWDPGYVEQSWIEDTINHQPIQLIPRIQTQIAQHYPGTRLSFSEYNYGGNNHISGAIAQADVLGVFGRYGLFAACNWGIGPKDTAELAGFRAFLDFDGRGSRFGDLGLTVQGENPVKESVYAALDSRSGKRLTIVAINKTNVDRPMRLALKRIRAQSVKAYCITASSLERANNIQAETSSEGISFTAPPLSVTSLEVATGQ